MKVSVESAKATTIHLFIDANIFLGFYDFKFKDLQELEKLEALLKSSRIKLYTTTLLQNEFIRNREKVINNILNDIHLKPILAQYPVLVQYYKEDYEKLANQARDYNTQLTKIKAKITGESSKRVLGADRIVRSIFSYAENYDSLPFIELAQQRKLLGNPPHCREHIGDKLHWETLLHSFPKLINLHFVTNDVDFKSPLHKGQLHDFLVNEWSLVKESKIFCFDNLTEFFKEHFSEIKIVSDVEKQQAIETLVHSSNFVITHQAVAKLSQFNDFSDRDIKRMADAALENSQISLILSDSDVLEFFNSLYNRYKSTLNQETKQSLINVIAYDLF